MVPTRLVPTLNHLAVERVLQRAIKVERPVCILLQELAGSMSQQLVVGDLNLDDDGEHG